jgi:hypothetical protein
LQCRGFGAIIALVRAILLICLATASIASATASTISGNPPFVGSSKYNALVNRGVSENWAALPIGERTARVGLALAGTPYVNYTLEISARTERPCVNFNGLDCWTFFETSLGTARALKRSDHPSQAELLKMIEVDRYRGGRCTGLFTSRLHQLEDWLYDNQKRGLVKDITPSLPGAVKIRRDVEDMAPMGARIPQFRANPSLIPVMARIEQQLSARGIWYVPKSRVPAAEKYLQNGDIICIVSNWPKEYTSHVGLAYRDKTGTLRFLHASKTAGRVLVDSRLSDYLAKHGKQAGIMVARPRDI